MGLGQTKEYIYDGWNLFAEARYTAAGVTTQFWAWGLDLSGTLQGAGGIGGLLCTVQGGAISPLRRYYAHDANGNVTEMVDPNGNMVSQYRYDPFGNSLLAIGGASLPNPFRFSSKYLDDETGWVYYGYRFYSPQTGRWLSRDPINEPASRVVRQEAHDSDDEELLHEARGYLQVAEAIDRATGKNRAAKMREFVRRLEMDVALTRSSVRDASAELNLYLGIRNDPIGHFDALGLDARAIAAELCQMDGPYPIGDIIAVGILACCLLAEPHGCYPCSPPVGTVSYRGPETHAHWPFSAGSTHYHIYTMHQSPWPMCRCFWSRSIPYTVGSPPPGSVPITTPGGGGAY